MPKAVQLLLNSFLPEDLRNYSDIYDVKTLNRILANIAEKYPDSFEEIQHKMAGIGRKASYLQGDTITLKDLAPAFDRQPFFDAMDNEIKALDKKDPKYNDKRDAIFQKYNDIIEKQTAKDALAQRNDIAMAVLSGARGKNPQLKAMISTPGTYSDYKGRIIPVFSRKSFAEGVSPALFLASTYGARSSVTSAKVGTAKGGDLGKQFASTAANLVVRKKDCGTDNGRELSIDDDSLKGRFLARDVAGVPAGTLIDKTVLKHLKKSGVENVVARSMMTCAVEDGVCAHCVGKFYDGGKLPKIGTHVGTIAASVVAEPLAQMALCLGADTEVRMADFSIKKIQDIKPGEYVLGADADANTFPVKVINTYDQGIQEVQDYTFGKGQTKTRSVLTATENHKVLLNKRSSSAYNFNKYGRSWGKDPYKLRILPLKDINKNTHACYARSYLDTSGTHMDHISDTKENRNPSGHMFGKIVSVTNKRKLQCYDIEVDHPDHLFVLANGLIVSNSAKHTAGMSAGKKSYSGLPYLIQFTQSPEAYPDRAPVAEEDGKVSSIEEAGQGGYYVTVGSHRHYVPSGHEVTVKEGDTVEAGDALAEGLIDAEDIIRLKGLGAGRLYYADRLNQMLADSGAAADKRNTEALARAAIRHVKINNPDGLGVFLPGDTADYEAVASSYRVPETATELHPSQAIGMRLQKPVLHYSIGTRITKSVAKTLDDNGYSNILVDNTDPDFTPEMVRLRAAPHNSDDWLASMTTSYLGQQINNAATRGDDTNIEHNPDYRPRLMVGKDFGKNVEETGEF